VPGSPSGAEAGGAGLTAPGYEPPSGTGLTSDVEGPAAEGADETAPQQTAGGGVPLAGQPPMMPGAGQPGAGQPGAGAGIPDAPDAQGLVDADLADWRPAGGDLGDPSAPQGTAAGGAGLEVPQWEAPGDLPSAADPAFEVADDVTLPEYGATEGTSDTPAGMPAMPGLPGGTAPPGALPPADSTNAFELIDADAVDWQPAEAGTIPYAPTGAAAGGGGLQTSTDIPPPAIPVESVVSLPGTDGPVVDWPTTDAPPGQGPAMDGPVADWPTTDAPPAQGPATDAPVVDWATVDGPTAEWPVVDGPATAGAATDAPVVTEPVAADPGAVEAPVVTEPVMPEPVMPEPVQAEPVQAEPVQAEPVAADPVAVEPVVAVPALEPALPPELVQDVGTGLQTPPDAADAVPVERPAVQQMAATAAATVTNAAPANPNGSAAPADPGEDDAAALTLPAVVFPVSQPVVPQPVVPPPPSAASAPAALGRDAVAAGTLPHDPRLAAAIPGRPQPDDDREAPERPDSAELLHDGTGAWDAAGPVDGTPAGDDFVPVITVDDDDMSGWDDVDGAAWLTDASPRG
jgi:integrin beta 3